ncbi:MAG TPA: polysaccharide deacetylase family protein [Cytophagaceae bacterium]|nr:polysaccharide deacetylase family protein [Cytophagaceae bacterium]
MKIKHRILLLVSLLVLFSVERIIAQQKKTKPLPTITSTEIWIDRFDNPNGKSLLGGDWYTFTDKSNGGISKIFPEEIKNVYKNNAKGDSTNFLQFQFQLDKGRYQWEPYIGLGVSIIDSLIAVGIDNLEGIAYDYKGSKHSFVYQLSSVKDYAHYMKKIPGSVEWKTVVLPISELKQPSGWGKPVPFNPSFIEALQWTVLGKTGDTGILCIDNVRLLLKLPPKKNIVPVTNNTKVNLFVNEPTGKNTRTISDKIKIADWHGFCKAAYSLSFDDGLISQYQYALPILDKYQLKATFYIITESLEADSTQAPSWRFGYWYQFKQMAQAGHEIGSHTATHPRLTTLPDGKINEAGTLQYELSSPIQRIHKMLPGYPVITFAYPFVDYNNHVMEEAAKWYVSSRGLGSGLNAVQPANWMNLQAHSISYTLGRTKEADLEKITEFKNFITSTTLAKGGWSIYLAHDVLPFEEAIEATDSWQPVSLESFEVFAQWLANKKNNHELWIETIGNITRYIKERESVSVTLKEETANTISFLISDSLPDELFHYPLTLEITLPLGWKNVIASQKDKVINLAVVDGKIQIDAIPDQGILDIQRVE